MIYQVDRIKCGTAETLNEKQLILDESFRRQVVYPSHFVSCVIYFIFYFYSSH